VVSGTNPSSSTATIPGSDYLVIKSARVAFDVAAKKWNYVKYSSLAGVNKSFLKTWGVPGARLGSDWLTGERVIALNSTFTTDGTEDKQLAVISTSPGSFYYAIPTYVATPGAWVPPNDAFKPADSSKLMIMYGIADAGGATLSAPYNRADYYIDKSSSISHSAFCAPGTGTLVKAVMDQGTGQFNQAHTFPILDCVGDLQVVYALDMNDDGVPGTYANADGSVFSSSEGGVSVATVQSTLASAASLRSRLKQVIIYVLAHEGQKDTSYQFPVKDVNRTITVVDPSLGIPIGANRGGVWKQTDLVATFGSGWNNYRWKVYTIAVKPANLN
jgi:hypothetical protein